MLANILTCVGTGTIGVGVGLVINTFRTKSQKRKAEEMCSPEFQPQLWNEWRERINGWAGGIDTYQEIYDVARQIPKETLPENVEPRRWWKA